MSGADAAPPRDLDEALARWLETREDDPRVLPGAFAATLPPALRSQFLQELEAIAEIDRVVSQAPPRDLPLRFGDHRILRQLGQGGMGTVYEAEQVSSGRRVALKVLHPHFAAEARTAARFEREAHTAAALVHPRIAAIHGYGRQEGFAWIAMDLVPGRSLQRLLAAALEPRDLDHPRARALFDDHRALAAALADAADALSFAHGRGVVHRDVKPANLMLGDDGRLTVLDFGLASTRGDGESDLTRTGDFLGTPLYMSPEQASGERRIGPASDVYSLGAVLYECLTGRPSVAAGPLPAILDGIRHRRPRDPRRLVPDVPAELALVARKCLEKEPGWRYGSAAELADDLRRFVDGVPVRARPAGWPVRLGRALRRRPLLSAAAAVAAVLAIGGAAFGLQRGARLAEAELRQEVAGVSAQLALSPQGITVFGGAVRRWFEQAGFGDHLPAAERGVAEAAATALVRAERLAADHADDPRALRLLVRVSMDLGDDPARTRAALERLLALDAAPGDHAMLAVQCTLEEDLPAAERILDGLRQEDAGAVHFARALCWQLRQDYPAAIAAFDRALQAPDLDEEQRYFALLHRGWCRTCAEVGELRAAEDDLLAAATLRPGYGTARLLWAALRCLDPEPAALQAAVTAVTEVLTAVDGEPWVVVLTARVLLGFAEHSTVQSGPVRWFAGLSPLVPLPLEPGRRQALAATALQLLDGVVARRPGLWEPELHRVAALSILGRHDDALAAVVALGARPDAELHQPLLDLLAARAELAAGRVHRAAERLAAATDADPELVPAHLLAADLAAHVGDGQGELAALHRAAGALPPQAGLLPHLQERIAAVQRRIGDAEGALATLAAPDFGSALSGHDGPRARSLRAVLTAEARAALGPPVATLAALAEAEAAIVAAAPRSQQPLHALLSRLAPLYDGLGESAQAARLRGIAGASQAGTWWRALELQRRGWLVLPPADALGLLQAEQARRPHQALAGAVAAAARAHGEDELALATLRQVHAAEGCGGPSVAALAAELVRAGAGEEGAALIRAAAACAEPVPLAAFRAEVAALDAGARGAAMALAEARLGDGTEAEARLLKACLLFADGRHEPAMAFLQASAGHQPEDLRARLLLACAAQRAGRDALARAALCDEAGRPLLRPAALPALGRALGVPIDAATMAAVRAML